jgi:short-subunit dehydrogenase
MSVDAEASFAHVVITGASRGLGAAVARRLARPGRRLGLIARGAAGLGETAAACRAAGAAVEMAALDVREAGAMAACLADWERVAPIGGVIANAGINGGTGPDGAPEGHAAASAQIAVNLMGAINLVEPTLPAMLARRRGAVLLVGSVAGFVGLPDSPAYSASKAGIWAYGEALRAAHGPAGLRVTVVAPGFFESAMSARFLGGHPFELPVEAVAARVERALLRGEGRAVVPWVVGAALRGLALLPAPMADRLVRRFRFRIASES